MSNDTTKKNANEHPMYYTETYHRGLVDKELYGLTAGVTAGSVAGIVGAVKGGGLIKDIERSYEATLSKGGRFGVRAGTAVIAAISVGYLASRIGQFAGYVHAISSGPRPEQLNGWTGKVEADKQSASTQKSI